MCRGSSERYERRRSGLNELARTCSRKSAGRRRCGSCNQRARLCAEDGGFGQLGVRLHVKAHFLRLRHGEVTRDQFDVHLGVVEDVEALDGPGVVPARAEWDDAEGDVGLTGELDQVLELGGPDVVTADA